MWGNTRVSVTLPLSLSSSVSWVWVDRTLFSCPLLLPRNPVMSKSYNWQPVEKSSETSVHNTVYELLPRLDLDVVTRATPCLPTFSVSLISDPLSMSKVSNISATFYLVFAIQSLSAPENGAIMKFGPKTKFSLEENFLASLTLIADFTRAVLLCQAVHARWSHLAKHMLVASWQNITSLCTALSRW